MTLGEKKENDVRDWLKEKGVRQDCIACDHIGWEVGDIIAPPAAPHGGGTVIGGPSFGLAQIFCRNCGFVMHFNSSQIGLTKTLTESQS